MLSNMIEALGAAAPVVALLATALLALSVWWFLRRGPAARLTNRPRWRTCLRKRSYRSKKEAGHVVGRHALEGDVVHAYQCPYCKRWHVGHRREPGRAPVAGRNRRTRR